MTLNISPPPLVPTLRDAIVAAGLTTNNKLCLDFGDPQSWPGTGQKWLDRAGGGYDFFFGVDGSSSTDDPTPVGGVGNLEEAAAEFDGGDFFAYDATNEAWMDNIHQDVAQFTILALVDFGAARNFLLANSAGPPVVGFDFRHEASGTLGFQVVNSVDGTSWSSDAGITAGINMVAVSIDEPAGAGGGFFWANGAYMQVSAADTFNAAYASPSADPATYPVRIGATRSGSWVPTSAGERIIGLAAWEGQALTKAELDRLFAILRGRFGI